MKRLATYTAALLVASASWATSVYTAGPGLALAVPDATYNGTQGTMACNTINVASEPGLDTINGPVRVTIAMVHSWVGDLVIKLIGPVQSFTLVSRPGVIETADDGNDTAGFGEDANLAIANPLFYEMAAPTESEAMGTGMASTQTVCLTAPPCNFNPDNGASTLGEDLSTLNTTSKVGAWTLCIGDAGGGDLGTLDGWTLDFGTVTPVELLGLSVE